MKKPDSYDFCGWATRNDILCSDGRTIKQNAFKECDGKTVPLLWNHNHADSENVLGHALLENRPEGVYCYGSFNNTERGANAKEMLKHGDITSLSIFANKLQHHGREVVHGFIREVSLVLAGANPGASIDYVLSHGDIFDEDSEGIIYTDETISLYHSDEKDDDKEEKKTEEDTDESEESEKSEEDTDDEEDENSKSEDSEEEDEDLDKELNHAEEESSGSPKNLEEAKAMFDSFTDEQKELVYGMIGAAVQKALAEQGGNNNSSQEDNEEMKHNVFDTNYENQNDTLSHSEIEAIFNDVETYGTLKKSCLQHGITDIDVLFPDAKAVANEPSLISRNMDWVDKVLNSTHHTPFSRVKSLHANITADEARARGYVKGNQKVEEVILALQRKVSPQTIYKKQALDRDDIIDITDFNVVAFLKAEMRVMLNEEIARAILIGDGRSDLSPDKIKEEHIIPIWNDDPVYTITKTIEADPDATKVAKAFIKTSIKSRKEYKGSGNPVLFTTEDMLTDMLLIEDGIGRPLYDTIEKLKTALRVSDIVTVPVMEGYTKTVDGVEHTIGGLIVNLKDYNVGADQGGSVSMFDDFDIDYNKEKYLIETRCSGALVVPYSAIAIDIIPKAGNNAASADNSEVTEG